MDQCTSCFGGKHCGECICCKKLAKQKDEHSYDVRDSNNSFCVACGVYVRDPQDQKKLKGFNNGKCLRSVNV